MTIKYSNKVKDDLKDILDTKYNNIEVTEDELDSMVEAFFNSEPGISYHDALIFAIKSVVNVEA